MGRSSRGLCIFHFSLVSPSKGNILGCVREDIFERERPSSEILRSGWNVRGEGRRMETGCLTTYL